MKHRLLYIPILLLFSLSFVDCARKGTPSGGPLDSLPPIIVRSNPENYTTNFTGKEIEIRFDEYIKLKNLTQQLIISPPMKYSPIITPLSTSKTLKIHLVDTLKPNTTYTFNFGNSIVDNNEENPFPYFKYVFSTGTYIDSLNLTGSLRDARLIAPEIPTTVMLYEATENFKDSLIYSEKPTYITVTKDSTGFFEFTNLKEGNYLLIALNEKGNDYTFQPKSDKIGFVEDLISVPTDSVYSLTMFKEIPDYKLARPSLVGTNHIIFGYEGKTDSLNIELISEKPRDYETISYKDETKDTLHYWFKPAIKTDSLVFAVANGHQIDTATVRFKELFSDSLNISAVKTGSLKLADTFTLRANTPLVSFDVEKFQVMAKDSTLVKTTVQLDTEYNRVEVIFPKEEAQNYTITMFPAAVTNFFEKSNDTLSFTINTRTASDYGTLNLNMKNVDRFPVIVQIVDTNYRVVAEKYLTENNAVFFDELSPNKYFLRIIYDDNQNRKWDTGNFLNRMQPEKIIYYPTQIEVRANWNLNETFTLN